MLLMTRNLHKFSYTEVGPNLKIDLFKFLMHVLFFWFPDRFCLRSDLNLAKTARLS